MWAPQISKTPRDAESIVTLLDSSQAFYTSFGFDASTLSRFMVKPLPTLS